MDSILISFIFNIFKKLNEWYEHSLTHKIMVWIFSFFKSSIICNFIAKERNYWESGFFKFLNFSFISPIFKLFDSLLKTSFLFKVSSHIGSYIKEVVLNSTPFKLFLWFLSTHVSHVKMLFLTLSGFVIFMAIIPSHLWSNFFILAFGVFIFALFTFQVFTNRIKFEREFVPPSLVLFIFFSLFSLITSFNTADSIRVFIIMFASILISIQAIYILNSVARIRLFIGFIFVSLLLTSIYGIVQFLGGIEIRLDFIDLEANPDMAGRLFSTMGNPNNYAKFITMFLPFIISLFFVIKGSFKKIILLGGIALIVLVLLLTLSRASYLVLLGSLGVFVLVLKPRLVPIAIAFALLSMPFWPDFIMARLSTLGTDSSSIFRMWIWEGSLRMLGSYFITGVGIGPLAFRTIYLEYSHQLAGSAMHSHNVFLQVWLEIGIGGFLSLIAYNIYAIKKSIISFLKTENFELKLYIAAAISSVCAFLAFAMVEHVWFYPRTMLIYFITMGITLALIRVVNKEARSA